MKIATFIILADPQIGYHEYEDYEPQRQNLSMLNHALNNIATVEYPKNLPGITCSGQPVGKPDAVFFAGDLTNYGGRFNPLEWYAPYSNVADVLGGDYLTDFRALYDPAHNWDSGNVAQLNGCGPLYFGLGNHDVALPEPASYKWRDYSGKTVGTVDDYYNYQMWNFVNQMHTGYDRPLNTGDGIKPVRTRPRFLIPASEIDSDPRGTCDFHSFSFNYMIPVGPIDVYQLHFFGGDSLKGRKSGLDWLKRKLAERGYGRSVFVIQHLPPSLYNQTGERFWNETARDQLLEVLRPYDVRGFGVGHLHKPEYIRSVKKVEIEGEARELEEFMIGTAMDRKFGVVRVEQDENTGEVTVNVVFGFVEDEGKVKFALGWNDSQRFKKREVYVSGIEVVHLNTTANDFSHEIPWYVTEESGKSANINDGFVGETDAVYIKPLLTTNPLHAITGFELIIQDQPLSFADPDMQHLDLATPGRGDKHRYLVPQRICGRPPVKPPFLWRSDGKQAPRIGWALSADLNQGRGDGIPLYLEWEVRGVCSARNNSTGGT